ncbi:hypothetical protein BJ987_002358 [Nocardia goodfellowii]|uniref:Uncharacterized protein n=1 Tax=Nocardia goodfellowii TaxID=882446 RepID=A0ABS4QCP2_9NOCA|nr:hypothetical protein [Nocardia goodfellowii]
MASSAVAGQVSGVVTRIVARPNPRPENENVLAHIDW